MAAEAQYEAKRKALSRLWGLEEILSLEMTTKSIGAGTRSKSWRDREFRILEAEAAGNK